MPLKKPTSDIITVLGAGSWGTALASHIGRGGHLVRLWGRDDYVKEMTVSRCNKYYLPDLIIPDTVTVLSDFNEAVKEVRDILVAVPSHAFRSIINQLHTLRPNGVRIAWATKGIDSEKNQLLHDVIKEIYGPTIPLAIIAGPSFAKEVAANLPTAVTLTCNDADFSHDLIQRLHSQHFRVYFQDDFIGVQIAGTIKNCLAVAAGISDGLGYGANSRAALITRGLSELTRLGLAMGGRAETFMGLAGVGDLVLTCTDKQSRNLRFGYALGQGASVSEAEQSVGQVVEGKTNAIHVMALAKQYQVEMPITQQVCDVLSGKTTPYESV